MEVLIVVPLLTLTLGHTCLWPRKASALGCHREWKPCILILAFLSITKLTMLFECAVHWSKAHLDRFAARYRLRRRRQIPARNGGRQLCVTK